MMTAHVTGIAELDQALSDLPKAVSSAVLRTALKKAGQPVADEANSLAAAHVKTGIFAQSFIVATSLTKRQRKLRGRKNAQATLYVGSSDRKAHLIEFGTAPHVIQIKKKKILASSEAVYGPAVAHPGTPARPTLRPAWDMLRESTVKTFAQLVWIELAKAVKRLAKRRAKAAAAL